MICALALREGLLMPAASAPKRSIRSCIAGNYRFDTQQQPLRHVLSNSFWFWRQQLQPGFVAGDSMSGCRIHIEGIGLLGPALVSWQDAGAVLRGESAFQPEPVKVAAAGNAAAGGTAPFRRCDQAVDGGGTGSGAPCRGRCGGAGECVFVHRRRLRQLP